LASFCSEPLWAKLVIAHFSVAPAAVSGYHLTHGAEKYLMPSGVRQSACLNFGANAVGVASFILMAGAANPAQPAKGVTQAVIRATAWRTR
jgi:hypothetical protein